MGIPIVFWRMIHARATLTVEIQACFQKQVDAASILEFWSVEQLNKKSGLLILIININYQLKWKKKHPNKMGSLLKQWRTLSKYLQVSATFC